MPFGQLQKNMKKKLDVYEGYPTSYKKDYFYLDGNKVMFYIMETCSFKKPSQRYINIIKEGYQDCDLDLGYLEKSIRLQYELAILNGNLFEILVLKENVPSW